MLRSVDKKSTFCLKAAEFIKPVKRASRYCCTYLYSFIYTYLSDTYISIRYLFIRYLTIYLVIYRPLENVLYYRSQSGVYDLKPLVKTYVNDALGMNVGEADANSPLSTSNVEKFVDNLKTKQPNFVTSIVYAEHESPPFKIQAEELYEVMIYCFVVKARSDLRNLLHKTQKCRPRFNARVGKLNQQISNHTLRPRAL